MNGDVGNEPWSATGDQEMPLQFKDPLVINSLLWCFKNYIYR